MENFIYNVPTKVYFGIDSINYLKDEIIKNNFKNILFVYGKESIKKIGLYKEVIDILNSLSIKYYELNNIEPNPKLNKVIEGINLAKKHNIDFILAVGGGSVIDTAKAIANAALTDINPWDFNLKIKTPTKALKIGVILTISAAGSEMSNSCVITNETTNVKTGYNCDTNRVLFAVEDPRYTFSVSKYQTACGVVDMLMHTLERIVGIRLQVNSVTKSIAYGLLKAVFTEGLVVKENPEDYNARAQLMWASSLSHNGLTGCGNNFIMRVHQIEHALSGVFDNISHGAGLAILWPAWLEFIFEDHYELIAEIGFHLFDFDENDLRVAAKNTIDRFRCYFKRIGMPLYLEDVNVYETDIEKIALNFSNNKTKIIKDIKDIGYDECVEILKLAL